MRQHQMPLLLVFWALTFAGCGIEKESPTTSTPKQSRTVPKQQGSGIGSGSSTKPTETPRERAETPDSSAAKFKTVKFNVSGMT